MSTSINQTTVATIVQRRPLIKGRFYHSSTNEKIFEKIFLVTFKIVRDDLSYDHNDPDDNLEYDHEFFYQYLTTNYYVRCKFISHSAVLDLLNYEYDVNALYNEPPLTPSQKYILEQSLMVELYLRVSKETDEIIVGTVQD
ncbi:unnamed protein product [Rhizophagus irregularis]|jgi:hypothetical protein|uniref:Uncharacterized protein n=1 Tax=Rhizophagus irregularis TaxID=588596 RepID=A0A2I1G1B6_9GLOM|nr:hypothetical protein RhiirA4_453786 [Rhizophagus irregularis]CAB4433577.1 unnamed protein product [Rhizophagus irregularis]